MVPLNLGADVMQVFSKRRIEIQPVKWCVCMFVCLFATSVTAQDSGKVLISTAVTPVENEANHFLIDVSLEIKEGWHIYADVPADNPSPVTTLDLQLPEGVEAVGQWNRPLGVPDPKDPQIKLLEGFVNFSQKIRLDSSAAGEKIELKVGYQACNDKLCMPPKTQNLMIELPPLADEGTAGSDLAGPATDPTPPVFENKFFDAPVRLMVGAAPMNTTAKQMYPSPALFDVDGDGKNELVVGDIFGGLQIYENENKAGSNDPVWSEPTALMNTEASPIRVHNW